MKNTKSRLGISHLIVFAIFLLFFLISFFADKGRNIFYISAVVPILGYLAAAVLAGVPSIIRKLKKKNTFFLLTCLFGLILFLDFMINVILLSEVRILNIKRDVVDIILIIKLIFIAISVPLHASIYNKVGFFYYKVLKTIIEKVFPIKIISKNDFINSNTKDTDIKIKKEEKPKITEEKRYSFLREKINSLKEAIGRNKKKAILITSIAFASLVLLAGCLAGIKIYKDRFFTNIVSISPKGETNEKMVIKIIFSSDIEFKDQKNPGEVLKIRPRIAGTYQIEGRTLIFIPDRDLPLSTKYEATINTSLLNAPKKKGIETKRFYFNTRLMKVANASFYYNINEITKKPDELIGEIEFTLPVDFETVKERVEIKINKNDLTLDNIEPSERPNIIYIKIKGFEQGDVSQYIDVSLKKGIMPLGGTIGLEDDYKKSVLLKERERLQVEQVETFPVVGNTYIAIKFNMGVNEAEVKKHVSIEPSIKFNISAEYRYIVLEANFEPNLDYTIKINKEIKAKDGTDMKEDYARTVVIRDMQPYVKFASEGKILPMTDNLNIEFASLNLDKVNFSVEKIYKNNLIHYLSSSNGYDDDYYGNSNTNRLYTKTFEITEGNINEEVKNLINLRSLFNSRYQGFYKINISDPREYYHYNSMTVNITNMGLIIKNNGENLIVYVVNILNLNPMPQVKLSLVSRENQILQSGLSDSNGQIIFRNYSQKIENMRPFLIYAEKDEDFTFLMLDRNSLDYSTFDVSGRSYESGIHEAYITTERGVYRPGEDVYASLIIRKADISNPSEMPLTIKSYDPSGKEIFNKVIKINKDGIDSITIPTEYQYKTGEYRLSVYQDRSGMIGSTSFKIEDFIPQKIEVKLELLDKKNDEVTFKVRSNELHGAPLRGLKVRCDAVFKSMRFFHKDYDDYNFYNENNDDFYQITQSLGEGVLDEKGEKTYTLKLPESIRPPSAIRAIIYTEVFDDTGRPVSDALAVDMHKYSTYFGIKEEGAKPYEVNKELKVKYAAITPGGKEVKEDNVRLKIERKVWYSIFKKFSWTTRYSSETYSEVIFDKYININGKGEIKFNPDKGGSYTISVAQKNGMTTTKSFHVYDSKIKEYRDLSEPYKLILNLDKEYYSTGDTAYLTIIAPFDGKALVSYEREKIYTSQFVNLSGGKAVIRIAVTNDFVPNMYISVMAYRKPDYEMAALPPVSYGAVNIAMDKQRLSQEIQITAPAKTKSSDGLNVDLYLPDGAGTKVIIAAVDEGILQITNYQRPDPYDFFFRKRKLSVRTNTSLKDLLPDIAPYKKAFGGGFEGDLERRHLNPIEAQRVKSLSLYSGILECNSTGRVSHSFKMHQFNGKVRVMVMSAKDRKFGSTQTSVTISDPIVVSPGIPRFMSPKDKVSVPVKVYNKTEKDGKFNIALTVDGPLEIDGKDKETLEIKKDGIAELNFKINAKDEAGVAHIRVDADGNGETTFNETELAVRPAAPLETKVIQGEIAKNREEKLTLDENYIKEGQYKQLIVSSKRTIKYLGALEYLIRYPYGCTEQTVSQAFPLLYLKNLAENVSLFSKNPFLIDKYINVAIKKVEDRIHGDGEFVFWYGGRQTYPWISDYASHFIIEAKRSGYPVSDKVYMFVLQRLGIKEKPKAGRLDRRLQNLDRYDNRNTYKLFLRSLVGAPDFDSMQYYYDLLSDEKKAKTLSEVDRFMMAAAYAAANEKEKAKVFLPNNLIINTLKRKHSGNFGSYVRNTALYLYALSLIDPDDKRTEFLENELYKNMTKKGHFGNTQDTAWSLMALNYSKESESEALNVEIYKGEILWKKIDKETVFGMSELADREYTIKNLGVKKIYYNYDSFGYPLFPDNKGVSEGLTVSKEYFDVDGKPVDIKNIKQGDQVVITLRVVNETKDNLENLVLLDLLPAGLEIENPRIASRGDYSNIPANNINIDYEDIRDDRLILFVNSLSKEIRFSYVTRAVSPGDYNIPQFITEAMYDPSIRGKTDSKENLVVKEK